MVRKRAPMKRPRCDLFKVCALVGVRLLPFKLRYAGPMRPRDCFCRGALRRVGRRHGEGHLALTLRLIVETGSNEAQLYQETVTGIALLLARHPSLTERGLDLFKEFDRIDLGRVRKQAKVLSCNTRVAETISVLLALKLLENDLAMSENVVDLKGIAA